MDFSLTFFLTLKNWDTIMVIDTSTMWKGNYSVKIVLTSLRKDFYSRRIEFSPFERKVFLFRAEPWSEGTCLH